jgi:Ser/Thr protein kinase RdoA (MazF antagonist)
MYSFIDYERELAILYLTKVKKKLSNHLLHNNAKAKARIMNKVTRAAIHFIRQDENIAGIEVYGRGIIHDTYLVRLSNGENRFILQRINTQVFTNPAAIMHNLELVCEHIQKRMQQSNSRIDAAWQMLNIIPARDGQLYFIDADGSFWRALSFIKGATTLEYISGPGAAREVGRALGTFHWLLSDLNAELLHDTLPGFHNVEQYLKHYDDILDNSKEDASGAGRFCQRVIEDRRSWAPVLENGSRDNILTQRVIHGDPKINNFMVDRVTGKAVSIIDLDTVMPNLVQCDIGDCLRSCCNTMGEESGDYAAVRFDLKRCAAVLSGYTETARSFLTDADYDFLFDAIRLIPYELGLRFYTDFLEGDVYFKVSRRNQNLERAMVQFKLVASIERQEEGIRGIIEECRAYSKNSNSK